MWKFVCRLRAGLVTGIDLLNKERARIAGEAGLYILLRDISSAAAIDSEQGVSQADPCLLCCTAWGNVSDAEWLPWVGPQAKAHVHHDPCSVLLV
jgi:hypothetical protein